MEDEYKEIVQNIHLQKDCVYIIFSFKKKSYKLLSSVVSYRICMVLYILIVLVDGFTHNFSLLLIQYWQQLFASVLFIMADMI